MPRPGPRLQQVAVRLDEETIRRLDAELAAYWEPSATRSDLIRYAIDAFLDRTTAV